MRFNPEVQIHKESYILVEELTKSRVSLNPFLTQLVTKTDLELLTITKMGNTNFQGSPHKTVAQGQPLTV
jgi:hypothetical protein